MDTVVPLWRTVQAHLGLSPDATLAEDQRKVLQGLASIVDGIGAFRTHIGSAHGRGMSPPELTISEARLAVNAAHTIVRS
ncbi:abortive infection family protein [Sinorhizobium meliloti]|uniref:abortive infection family protein n=1 Tax=Rhizobium meliloti TaxID=382 RepID=UPI003F744933